MCSQQIRLCEGILEKKSIRAEIRYFSLSYLLVLSITSWLLREKHGTMARIYVKIKIDSFLPRISESVKEFFSSRSLASFIPLKTCTK
jgi:hypothetical protein